MTVLAVALGGALGAALRWWLAPLQVASGWPAGTLAANGVGCALAGVLVAGGVHGVLGAGLVTGLCGGLTTFSTAAVESATAVRHDRARYVGATAAVAAAGLGLGLAAGSVVV